MNAEHLKELVAILKTKVQRITEDQWQTILIENYRQFAILDQNKKWIDDVFAIYGDKLLPSNFSQNYLSNFLDQIERCLLQNPYFMDMLSSIPYAEKDEYSALIISPGSKNTIEDFLKYLIGFAFCLEQINVLAKEDVAVQENLITLYKINRKKNNFYRFSNTLGIIKFHSIELPLVRFLKAKKKNFMPANFGKYILSLNIFEASLVDLLTGFWNNALATVPLIFFSPNFKGILFQKKYKRGSASSFSDGHKTLLMFSPEQKKWSDLYQVWNMAFVSQFSQAPYLLAKLLIPSVSGYNDRAGEYMHTRITALHLAMNYLDSAMNSPQINIDLKQIMPSSKKLTKLWGKINKECAYKYYTAVKK